ncbi:pantoate--beta-alanine ligase [bacterium]|nr:pantoate--beta-alanine ligase [bacterium]
MQLFQHIRSLQAALRIFRQAGQTIALVPTMGNLHEGHLALVEQAKSRCDQVVASIFVNPLQFGLNEDWDQYPRTLASDRQKLEQAGCDYLFTPSDGEVYPNGLANQTRVIVPTLTDSHCGASRPGHFEGVSTVVTKLFNIVQPDEAVFGLKDYQQLAVIRRMTEDLCMPVTIVAGDIVREPDGLAMSSRNSFLSADERARAVVLNQVLQATRQRLLDGLQHNDSASIASAHQAPAFHALEAQARHQIIAAGFKPDYFSISDAQTLEPAASDSKALVILGAMYADNTRLIDNVYFEVG